jgi:uncharacterized protein (TIGR03435 family)
MVSRCNFRTLLAHRVAVKHGLGGGEPGSPPACVAMGHLLFDSVEAFQHAWAPHADAIVGDVPNYTNTLPIVQVSEVKLQPAAVSPCHGIERETWCGRPRSVAGMKAAFAAITVLVCCDVLGGQLPEDRPAFEVATIRPSGPESPPISIRRLPDGRLVTSNTPLPMLIQWAYQLDEGRLLGVPAGLNSLRFDVIAKPPAGEPVAGRLQLMMRALLAERFKLAVHHETRELVAYTLVSEPGGPKVRVVTTDEPAGPNPFRMSDSGTLIGTRVTAEMLATVLSNQLGRPVQNGTGFMGAFDFTLRWAPDTAVTPGDSQARPSLFTAIREQLGFRLVAEKRPTDVVVIDHLERTPAEN